MVEIYEGDFTNLDKLRRLPELPNTSQELKLIAKHLNASEENLFLRERTTETSVKSTNLSNSRVIAFAIHGLIGGELPSLTEPALVMTPPTGATKVDDGLLKASEILQLKMNADFIILSSCNSASSDKLGAEGLSGLARAFIFAGARALIVSHWSLESSSAAAIYTGMKTLCLTTKSLDALKHFKDLWPD